MGDTTHLSLIELPKTLVGGRVFPLPLVSLHCNMAQYPGNGCSFGTGRWNCQEPPYLL